MLLDLSDTIDGTKVLCVLKTEFASLYVFGTLHCDFLMSCPAILDVLRIGFPETS